MGQNVYEIFVICKKRLTAKTHLHVSFIYSQVKQEGLLTSRQKLKVDVSAGTLTIIKADGASNYDHTEGKVPTGSPTKNIFIHSFVIACIYLFNCYM